MTEDEGVYKVHMKQRKPGRVPHGKQLKQILTTSSDPIDHLVNCLVLPLFSLLSSLSLTHSLSRGKPSHRRG